MPSVTHSGAGEEGEGLHPPAGAAWNDRPRRSLSPLHSAPWRPLPAPLSPAQRGYRPSAPALTPHWLARGQATGIGQSGVELRRLCSPQRLRG